MSHIVNLVLVKELLIQDPRSIRNNLINPPRMKNKNRFSTKMDFF